MGCGLQRCGEERWARSAAAGEPEVLLPRLRAPARGLVRSKGSNSHGGQDVAIAPAAPSA